MFYFAMAVAVTNYCAPSMTVAACHSPTGKLTINLSKSWDKHQTFEVQSNINFSRLASVLQHLLPFCKDCGMVGKKKQSTCPSKNNNGASRGEINL